MHTLSISVFWSLFVVSIRVWSLFQLNKLLEKLLIFREKDMSTIIPFGKYKGQPVEVLINDHQYRDWLMAQDWFRNKYQTLNTVIINNFSEPTNTPEHNKLMNKYLSDKFCLDFLQTVSKEEIPSKKEMFKYLYPRYKTYLLGLPLLEEKGEIILRKNFEPSDGGDIDIGAILKYTRTVDTSSLNSYKGDTLDMQSSIRIFVDVENKHGWTKVEVKPIVADDYPSIIRKCRSQHVSVLAIGSFAAEGSTLLQVKKMFEEEGPLPPRFKILKFDDTKQISIPSYISFDNHS